MVYMVHQFRPPVTSALLAQLALMLVHVQHLVRYPHPLRGTIERMHIAGCYQSAKPLIKLISHELLGFSFPRFCSSIPRQSVFLGFSSHGVCLSADRFHLFPIYPKRFSINSTRLYVVCNIICFVGFCCFFTRIRSCIRECQVPFSIGSGFQNFRVVSSFLPATPFDVPRLYRSRLPAGYRSVSACSSPTVAPRSSFTHGNSSFQKRTV